MQIRAALNVRMPFHMPKTVFVDEAAQILGVSRRTVYYPICEGKLKTVRTLYGPQRALVDLWERSCATSLRQQQAEALPLHALRGSGNHKRYKRTAARLLMCPARLPR